MLFTLKRAATLVALLAFGIARPSTACADDAIVTATETTLRTAPFTVAPSRRVLKLGERFEIAHTPDDGWRFAVLPDGVEGYVRDSDIAVTSVDSTTQPPAAASASAGTPPGATASLKPPPTVSEREWYSGQMAFIYLPAAFLIGVGATSNSPEVTSAGWLGVLLAPPVLHLAHGNRLPALASFGMRILFIGTAIAFVSDCVQIPIFGGQATTSHSGKCDALAVSTIAEMIALPVMDVALASKMVERQPPRLGLAFVPRPDSRSLSLALAGSF
jgi:hypothetical protein